MYKVCLYNAGQETLIHYPTADKEAPHLFKMDLQEKDNDVDTFSFSIDIGNAGYNSLREFKTKVNLIDTRDNSIRFTGRLLKAPEKMDSNGFYKEASCESALAYLLDSNTRTQTYLTADVKNALQDLLDRHNAIVEDEKKIYLGTIGVIGSIAYTCQYESTLSAMTNMLKGIECHLQVREDDGKLYLDCLKELNSRVVEVRLGENMKEMIKTYDPTGIGTRIIPLGANNLTIADANGGLDYIEDLIAKGLFGVIEKPVSYSDITDAAELKSKATADINNYTQPSLTFEINALDLSTLSSVPADTFRKGLNLHIINPVMGIDDVYTIVEVDADLTQVYNPKLTISNIPATIQDIISRNENNALNNDSIHNGVQVGDSFGIRVSSSDGKIVITINALEGITIEDVVKNLKKFFIDTDGNLTMDGIQKITKDNKVIIENTFNNYGGINNIYDKDGNLVFKLGVESGSSDNVGATLIGYNKGSDKPRFKLGIAKDGDFGTLQMFNSEGKAKAVANGNDKNNNGVFFIVDSNGIRQRLATERYVQTYVADHMPSTPAGGGTSGS
ncbi:phage tail spike protein [Clostridium sp. AWRP]|uniref:phage tail spike protein n=1 Tax=Clostridium sp. AWRP TaxID=2212991 RepID=UPI000FDA2F6D|nr:phage tail spike protein [Clostridium sp. AWRP]AZV58825.1 hypothetical protein DMR38_20815 [Clostridium sp. AWRP]